MKKFIAGIIAMLATMPAVAQTTAPVYDGSSVAGTPGVMILQTADGRKVKVVLTILAQCNDAGTICAPASSTNPIPTTAPAGSATSARQDTSNNYLQQIAVANGNPTDAKCTATDATACTEIAVLKGIVDRAQAFVNALGSPFQTNGTIANTVFGATQSGTWNVGLTAGANIVGKMGIDQTTPGTSNGIVQTPTTAAAAGIAPSPGGAATGGVNFKTGAGNVYGVQVTSAATAGYVIMVDTTSGADGAVVPIRCYTLAANSSIEPSWRDAPLRFTNGLFVFFSTTGCYNKTQSNTAYIVADVK